MKTRSLDRIIRPVLTSDGAGVRLQRSLGQSDAQRHDPFLLLDEFSSENPDDYIAGFPSHPHRGFETITYLLDGHMLHEDHLGHRGDLRSGGAQWMSAGRGIIHSEMPQQERGRMRGFQLWINLPARDKMKSAAYRDLQPEEIPQVTTAAGGVVRVIAGTLHFDAKTCTGPLHEPTAPMYFDVRLAEGAEFGHPLPADYNALVYPYEGSLEIAFNDAITSVLAAHQAGILSAAGDGIEVRAGSNGARFLLLAARPLNEPVVQHGPFVMNTQEELQQAVRDYQNGKLV
jgi:redox-sensitive bicupin YhaK (pirin superfamily)